MASKAIGFLNFKFGADLSGFERAMKKAQKNLKKFGKNIQKTGKSLTMGLTLPIVGLGTASVKAFDKQAKAIAQVEAGLKSTGNAVGFTSEKLQTMAADLQKTTLFGDEEILQGATAQLLTFTNIAGEQFARTQKVALDLATRLDGDLKSSSIMLGKALNDPVANLSALSRAGIQFSADQKQTIKSLVETNRLAEAQTIILEELEKQYGGSAEAAAQAGMGPIKQLQNQLSDLSEQIGARLIPFVKSFATWVISLAEKFDGLSESTKDNIVKWGLILAAIGPVLIIIGKMSVGISALIPLFTKLGTFLLANPWLAAAAAIGVLAFAIYDMTSAMTSQMDVQEEMGKLNIKAEKSIAKDLVNIEKLTGAIKDETTSLDDKLKALNTLQETYPVYYDAIDETTLSTQHLDTATETLTKNLMKVASLTAYQDKLVEIRKEMLELENTENVDLSTKIVTGAAIQSFFGPAGKLFGELTGKTKDLQTTIQKDINLKKYKELEELFKKLSGETVDLEKEVEEINKTFTKLEHNTGKLGGGTEEASRAFEVVSLSMQDVSLETEILESKLDHLEMPEGLFNTDPMDEYRGSLGMLGDQIATFIGTDIKLMEEAMASYANQLGDNLAQGAESFKEYGTTVKGIMREVIGSMISAGVAAAVRTALESIPPFPGSVFLIPVLAGAAAGLARTAFNSLIPEFADGGLVYGPTTALIGEGVGTTSANPEVVAPLDKLKSMMGGGNKNIIVEGILKGNDIYLSNKNTSINRLRTT